MGSISKYTTSNKSALKIQKSPKENNKKWYALELESSRRNFHLQRYNLNHFFRLKT